MMIEKGAEVNAKDEIGITPLHRASQRGHTDIAKSLIEKGADITEQPTMAQLRCSASDYGHIDIVKLLIEKGAEVNATTKKNNGFSPLMFATQMSVPTLQNC